jgi:hypothetical protein
MGAHECPRKKENKELHKNGEINISQNMDKLQARPNKK